LEQKWSMSHWEWNRWRGSVLDKDCEKIVQMILRIVARILQLKYRKCEYQTVKQVWE
jgi:hypothetical protein